LAAVANVVASADAAPTDQAYTVYEEQVSKINTQLQRLEQVMSKDLAAFNQLVREQNIPAVIVKPSASSGQPSNKGEEEDDFE
jgi:hypothetical protein